MFYCICLFFLTSQKWAKKGQHQKDKWQGSVVDFSGHSNGICGETWEQHLSSQCPITQSQGVEVWIRNAPIGSSTWTLGSLVGSAAWWGAEGAALLEGACHWGWALRAYSLGKFTVRSLLHAWCVAQLPVSATMPAYCHASRTWLTQPPGTINPSEVF